MKVEDPSALLVQWFYHKHKVLPERRRVLMAKLYQLSCPKCNNKTDFYRYGKDAHGHQKYQCKKCRHQWAPDTPERVYTRTKNYPACPVCGKATCITTENITPTIPALTKNAAIRCSYQSLRPFPFRPCPSSLERRISSECAIPSM